MDPYPYNPTVTKTVLWIVSVETILSLVINFFLLYVLYRLREKNCLYGFQLIILITLGDIISSASTLALGISNSIMGYKRAFSSSWYCPVYSFLIFFFHNISGILVGFLAIERYIVMYHQKHMSPKKMWLIIVIVSLIHAAFLILNSVSNKFVLDPTHCFCLPYGTIPSLVSRVLIDFLVSVPLIVLVFCYTSIFLKCYRLSLVNKEFFSCSLPIRALVFLVFYFICFFPKFLGSIWALVDTESSVPLEVFIMMPIGLNLVTTINPVMVLMLHYQVSNEVSNLMGISNRRWFNSISASA